MMAFSSTKWSISITNGFYINAFSSNLSISVKNGVLDQLFEENQFTSFKVRKKEISFNKNNKELRKKNSRRLRNKFKYKVSLIMNLNRTSVI